MSEILTIFDLFPDGFPLEGRHLFIGGLTLHIGEKPQLLLRVIHQTFGQVQPLHLTLPVDKAKEKTQSGDFMAFFSQEFLIFVTNNLDFFPSVDSVTENQALCMLFFFLETLGQKGLVLALVGMDIEILDFLGGTVAGIVIERGLGGGRNRLFDLFDVV